MKKQVRDAWDKKAALRYSDMLNDIEEGGKKPKYMEEETYERWLLYWDSSDAKKKSEQNSKNRKSGSIDGSALATHTGGSATHHKHAKRLAAKLGRKPFPREVHVHTHTKKGDGKTFINQKSESVNDNIETKLDQLTQNNEEIDELNLYYDSVGGMNKKKRIFGLGSKVSEYYQGPNSPTNNWYATQGPKVQETILELKQKVAEQQLIEDMQQQKERIQRQLIEGMQQQFSEQLQRQIDERIRLMIGASLE